MSSSHENPRYSGKNGKHRERPYPQPGQAQGAEDAHPPNSHGGDSGGRVEPKPTADEQGGGGAEPIDNTEGLPDD